MCSGGLGRSSQGGIIAILKPQKSDHRQDLKHELSLLFKEDTQRDATSVAIQGCQHDNEMSHVVIHRDGDLRSTNTSGISVMYRFEIPRRTSRGILFALPRRIDLGVGADGVIGRRVSLMSGDMVLGEGIIGWN